MPPLCGASQAPGTRGSVNCNICMTSMPDETWVALACGHVFHGGSVNSSQVLAHIPEALG